MLRLNLPAASFDSADIFLGDGPRPRLADPVNKPRRFHGAAILDSTRVGRDASVIADEVISHLSDLIRSTITVTIDVEAEISDGATDKGNTRCD